MAKKNNPLSDVFGFVQKAATDAVNAAGSIGESVKDGKYRENDPGCRCLDLQ